MQHKKKDIFELTNCSLREYREKKKLPVSLMADNVRSMYNVGAILRTADAFLLSEVVMAGITGCPPHPEISKTALGAEESVEWRHVEDAFKEAERMKGEGWKVCVLEQAHDSVPLQNFVPEEGERYMLVAYSGYCRRGARNSAGGGETFAQRVGERGDCPLANMRGMALITINRNNHDKD